MPSAAKYARLKEIANELMGMVGPDEEAEADGPKEKEGVEEDFTKEGEANPIKAFMKKPSEGGEDGMSKDSSCYTNASGGTAKGQVGDAEKKKRQMSMITSKLKMKMGSKY